MPSFAELVAGMEQHPTFKFLICSLQKGLFGYAFDR
jgi:hypothetical protein